MPSASASAVCEPKCWRASDLVMSAVIIGMPIFVVNRHADSTLRDNWAMGTMAERIKELRGFHGLTQKGAAKLAKIEQSSWSELETGETTPINIKGKTLLGVARALKSTPEYVLEAKGPPMALTAANEDENTLLASFRDLADSDDRARVLGFLEALVLKQAKASASAPFGSTTVPSQRALPLNKPKAQPNSK